MMMNDDITSLYSFYMCILIVLLAETASLRRYWDVW